MFERIRSYIDHLNGIGHCEHCKLSWNIVEGYDIPYLEKLPKVPEGHNAFMFPICKKCFAELPASAILAYCKQLVRKWNEYGTKDIDMDIIDHNIQWLKEQDSYDRMKDIYNVK